MTTHASSHRAEWIRATLDRYEGPLSIYAVRIVGDADRARDIVQETFLHLCRADRSRVENHLAAWLFRVCRNRALDMRRKEKRVESLEPAAQSALSSSAPGPDAVAAQREHTGQVLEILETLPESQREAVYLRFHGGLSYKQISEVTGHSVSNVGSLIHTAVRKIRERLLADERPLRTATGGAP